MDQIPDRFQIKGVYFSLQFPEPTVTLFVCACVLLLKSIFLDTFKIYGKSPKPARIYC